MQQHGNGFKWIGMGLSIVIGLGWIPPVDANQVNTIPLRNEVTVDPLGRASGVLTSINMAKYPIRVTIVPQKLSPTGTAHYPEAAEKYSDILSWVRVNPETFAINPQQKKRIRYIVKVPSGVPEGQYYLQLRFEETSLKQGSGNIPLPARKKQAALQINAFAAPTIYIYKGKVNAQLLLKDLQCHPISAPTKIKVAYTLENPGTKNARPGVTYTLKTLTGDLTQSGKLNGPVVFPDYTMTAGGEIALPEGIHPSGPLQVDLLLKDGEEEWPAIKASCTVNL